MSQIRYWVWLSALPGLSSRTVSALLRHYSDPMEVYFASDYGEVAELTEKERKSLSDKDLRETERILRACEEKDIRILTLQDADYPLRLKELRDAPAVLYIRGRLPYLDEKPVIALVGTRKASPYGIKAATTLGYQLASGGAVVVTGMALGADAAAARGALMGSGICVGVLGCAIDVDYPPQNASLIADVAATGCILSETPPGKEGMNFPRRNRIMSGLSSGVCIVEAPAKSGALITAELALEQGRDVFAIPGNIDNPNCVGSNRLLREGARFVCSGADILEEYSGLFPVKTAAARHTEPYETPQSNIDKVETISYIDVESRLSGCSEDQKTLLRLLAGGEKHMDELIAASGCSAAKVAAELTLLGIRGLVRALPGRRYSIK